MVQTGTPISTNSNNWTVTGAASAEAALASTSDSSLIETPTVTDLCNCSITTLTDPGGNLNYIIRFRAQATGSGAPERVEVKVYNSTTQRAASGNIAITRGSFADYSYTLTTGEADAIDSFSNLRVEAIAQVVGGTELLEVSYLAFEIPDASTGFAHSQGYVIG